MKTRGVSKSPYYRGLFREWEIAVAKKLVNEFQQMWQCLRKEEFDDLLQECLIHWLFARGEYDPTRRVSQQTFMGRVIRHKLTDLVRERETDKRKAAYLTVSLDEPLGDDQDDRTLLDKIDESTATDAPSDGLSQVLLKVDLSKALRKLTSQQQRLCRLLGEGGLTVKEASECLKTSRSTIYDEIERIRKIFRKEGLEDYLE